MVSPRHFIFTVLTLFPTPARHLSTSSSPLALLLWGPFLSQSFFSKEPSIPANGPHGSPWAAGKSALVPGTSSFLLLLWPWYSLDGFSFSLLHSSHCLCGTSPFWNIFSGVPSAQLVGLSCALWQMGWSLLEMAMSSIMQSQPLLTDLHCSHCCCQHRFVSVLYRELEVFLLSLFQSTLENRNVQVLHWITAWGNSTDCFATWTEKQKECNAWLKKEKIMGIFNQRYLNHMSHYSPSEYDF